MKSENLVNCETIGPETIARQIDLRHAGRRKNVRHGGTLCSKCLAAPPKPGHAYCVTCKRKSDKDWIARNKASLAGVAGEK